MGTKSKRLPARKKRASSSPPQFPLLWCVLQILGVRWEVWISDVATTPLLEGLEGYCDGHTSKIFISGTLPEDRKLDVLMHEVLHAVILLVGAHQILDPDSSSSDWEAYEEKLVLLLALPLFEALKRSGYLKFPKVPKLPAGAVPAGPADKRGLKCRRHGPKRTSSSVSRSCVRRAA